MTPPNEAAERKRLVVAARRRLARLKMASATASVVAFSGLTAAIAIQVYGSPVTFASAPAGSSVTTTSSDDGLADDSSAGSGGTFATGGGTSVNPAPAVVSAQS